MRRFVTLLVVVGTLVLLLGEMNATPAFADEIRPTAVSSVLAPAGPDTDALLAPSTMQDPAALLLPSSDPAFHLGLWWIWWTPWGPWLYWWFPPP